MTEESTVIQAVKNAPKYPEMLTKTGAILTTVKDYSISAAKAGASYTYMAPEALTKTGGAILSTVKDYSVLAVKAGASQLSPEALAKTGGSILNAVKDYSVPVTKTGVIFGAVKDYTITAARTGSSTGYLVLKDVASGKWIARFDRPHGTTLFSHINLNPRITKVPDPHIPISNATLAASKGLAKTVTVLESLGQAALVTVILVDTARMGNAVYQDYQNQFESTENTVKTGSSIAASWAGGFTGGYLGSKSGAITGGAVGSIFGGAGAAPGAGKKS